MILLERLVVVVLLLLVPLRAVSIVETVKSRMIVVDWYEHNPYCILPTTSTILYG